MQTAVGFPGSVRNGVIETATNLGLTRAGEGWVGVDLAALLTEAIGGDVRIANDADLAALACSRGSGVELTVTLGTGVGTGIVAEGVLQPHQELSELPIGSALSLDEYVGEPTRKKVASDVWEERVVEVLDLLNQTVQPDQIWLAGGNARRLTRSRLGDLEEKVWVVAEPVGLLGGRALFQ